MRKLSINPGVPLLLLVTLVWGTSFPLLKSATTSLNGLEISTIRFLVAALCMIPFLRKASRRTWTDGFLLGAIGLVSYVAQAYGLQYIASNRSAFLTSLNVLMVPFLGMLSGSRLSRVALPAALLACFGIGLMSWEGGGNLKGDSATVLCALAYALYILYLSRCAARHDASKLAATQIVAMAGLALLWMLPQSIHGGTLESLPSRAAPHYVELLYLGLGATAGVAVLQAFGQRKVAADKAALVYAMEPVFAVLAAWLWLGESLGWRGMIGGTLVVLALVLSEIGTEDA